MAEAKALPVYRERRVVLVRWHDRAKHGDPDVLYPEIDNRGTRDPEFAPVVGLTAGCEAVVRLERENLDAGAELHVATDNDNISIVEPADGVLPAGPSVDIRLKGEIGGDLQPTSTNIQIRFGSNTGPIVSVLVARCYTRLWVRIVAHVVTIAGPDGTGGTKCSADPDAILNFARAIWRPCGIDLVLRKRDDFTFNCDTPDVLPSTKFGDLLGAKTSEAPGSNEHWVAGSANVYFVPEIAGAMRSQNLGITFSRKIINRFGNMPHPAVIVGLRASDVLSRQGNLAPGWVGTVLAHELGHFMDLPHLHKRDSIPSLAFPWERRMLMYPSVTTIYFPPDDNGYGTVRVREGTSTKEEALSGALVSQKKIPQFVTDDECSAARAAIKRGLY